LFFTINIQPGLILSRTDHGTMNTTPLSVRKLTLMLAVIPACAVIIDYVLTFLLAGSKGMVLQGEASPLVRYAVSNDLMLVFMTAIVIFYYGAALLVLISLEKTPVYRFGVVLILLISITHMLGGMSWYFRSPQYSYSVMALSYITIVIAFLALGYAIISQRSGSAA